MTALLDGDTAPRDDVPGGRSRARTRVGRPSGVGLAALVVAALCLLPLAVVAWVGLRTPPADALAFLLRPRVGELAVNTASLAVLTPMACVLLGVSAAWLVERTDVPGRRVWRVLLVAPLAVPAFVNAFAWVSLRPGDVGLAGAVTVTTLSYVPFVVLPVGAVLRRLDPALEDSARALGLGPARTLARVVVPQLRPAALGGALLVTLHLLAEFGALAMMRFPTFTTAILEQYDASFTGASAELLACVLVVACLAVLALEALLRGRERYARLGPGVLRTAPRLRLRACKPLALAFLTALVGLSLGVPAYALATWLGAGHGDGVLDLPALAGAVGQSAGFALAAALAATVAAFPVAWHAERSGRGLGRLAERATFLASGLPGVVVALALVTLTVRHLPWLYQTRGLLVLAYTVLFLPRAVVALRAAIAQAPPSLLDAARALGVGPVGAVRRVLLPLVLPGAAAGAAMVAIAAGTELTATLLLAPTGTTTLATAFWSAGDSLDYATAAPYAVAMVLLSAPLTWVLLREARVGEDR